MGAAAVAGSGGSPYSGSPVGSTSPSSKKSAVLPPHKKPTSENGSFSASPFGYQPSPSKGKSIAHNFIKRESSFREGLSNFTNTVSRTFGYKSNKVVEKDHRPDGLE